MFKLIKRAPLITKNYQGFNDVDEAREFYENHGNDIYDKIIYNLIKNNYGFYGRTVQKTKDIVKGYSNQYFINHLKDYKEKLKDTILLNEDYKKVIKKYDNEKAFIFLDPPYEKSDKRSYENPIIDYEEMAKILKNIKGKFLLTLNDSPYIRQVFKDFNIRGLTVRSQGLRDNTGNLKIRKEVFIKNY
jgi:DNA adenine methylase